MGTHIGIVPTGAVTHALLFIFNGGNGTEWIPNIDVDWPVFTNPADQSTPL